MTPLWTAFCEGFFGAFRLAGNIVLAIAGEASAFVHGEPRRPPADEAAR